MNNDEIEFPHNTLFPYSSDITPTVRPAGKPLVPWVSFDEATILFVLLLGVRHQLSPSTTADRSLLRGSLRFDCQRDADLRAIFTLQMVSIA